MKRKKNKPKFWRTDFNKTKFKNNKWRKPRGRHNKLRLCKKGHQMQPKVGYGCKKDNKYKNSLGFYTKIINNISEISKLDKTKEVASISSKVGVKNKLAILKEAKKLNVRVVNVKDIDKFISNAEKSLEDRKKQKNKKITEKKKKEVKKEEKKETTKETEEEIKKEVLSSKIEEPKHKRVEQMPKDQKVDFPKQRIIPGNKS